MQAGILRGGRILLRDIAVTRIRATASGFAVEEGWRRFMPRGHFAAMMTVTGGMPAFVTPVVIGTGRQLSFRQTANGTVVLGGGIGRHRRKVG